jgi:FKBP-type peptidyl-prolyl cis-trans isomerase
MIKGIKKGSLKRSSPMTEDECFEALATLQQKTNEKKALKNIQIAENFLLENQKDKNIIELEIGKLQYKQIKKGEMGSVESYHSPIVKITGRYLDGKVFIKLEETINLNETLLALKKAIVGMQLHEKRKIFAHPDLSFGKNYPHLNSLIIFDIEVLEIDAKKEALKEIANPNNFSDESHTF